MSALTIAQLESMTVKELYSLAREYKIANVSKLTKKEFSEEHINLVKKQTISSLNFRRFYN